MRIGHALNALKNIGARPREMRGVGIRRLRARLSRAQRRGQGAKAPQKQRETDERGERRACALRVLLLRPSRQLGLLGARGEFHMMRAAEAFLVEVDDEILLELLPVP